MIATLILMKFNIGYIDQLTTYDEDEWDSDNLTVMRKTQNVMDSKMQQAHDWLQDPQALHGGVGEKSVRQVNENQMKKRFFI